MPHLGEIDQRHSLITAAHDRQPTDKKINLMSMFNQLTASVQNQNQFNRKPQAHSGGQTMNTEGFMQMDGWQQS
jgi:hypothetical protein